MTPCGVCGQNKRYCRCFLKRKAERDDACYCSEYQSSGLPCRPGECPNTPERKSDAKAEKPDDQVVRCARPLAYPRYHVEWDNLVPGCQNELKNTATTVLEAAGVERLRAERDEALRLARDLARDLEQSQAQLRLADEYGTAKLGEAQERSDALEKAEHELAAARHHNAALNSKLEGEKRVSQLLRAQRNELVVQVTRHEISTADAVAKLRELASQVEREQCLGWLETIKRTMFLLDSGQPAATGAADSSDSAQHAEKTETAGCSGPDNGLLGSQVIRDLVTVVLDTWAALGLNAHSGAAERLKERYR